MRLETPDAVIQLNSLRPLDDAIKHAFLWLIDWLVEDYTFSPREAYIHTDVNPEVRINATR